MPPLVKLEASTASLSFDGNALFPLPLYTHGCIHHPTNSSDYLCAGRCAKAACFEGRPPVQPSWGSHVNGNTVRKRVHRPIKSKMKKQPQVSLAFRKQSIPMKPFITQNGKKRKSNYYYIYMRYFYVFQDPNYNLPSHPKYT